jgi:cobalt-precorrin 5A hydrolase
MIRIIALTEAGLKLAHTIHALLNQNNHENTTDVIFKPSPFTQTVQSYFSQGDRLILICAMGIAVRTLAPVLKNKYEDPAVLVLDEKGQFVVPLISGHEGGSNDWANDIANALNGTAVITTAKPYLKPIYTLGMGCERDCPNEYLVEIRDECLAKAGLTLSDIHSVNSIDIKADETGLIWLADIMQRPFDTWQKHELAKVEHQLSTKSDYIFKTVGVYGVAESAALAGASHATCDVAELILPKHKNAKATCAIARSYPRL